MTPFMNTADKIKRISGGGKPRLLDLFAGCGGLSLGFQAAGFEIVAGVEFDKDAAASHGLNFHPDDKRHGTARDITQVSPAELCQQLGLGPVTEAVDVIVGGPPCQAFARVGRAKLREVLADEKAFLNDPRAKLYQSYLRYVREFEPLAILMENVPDVLNHGGQNIAEQVCDVLESMGYNCAYTLLNTVFYGIPQMRERMFLVAYRHEIRVNQITFPEPTNWHDLPPGYEGSRQVAKKLLNGGLFEAHDYVEPPEPKKCLKKAISAEEAIGDLPPLDARKLEKEGKLRKGPRRFDKPMMAYDRCRPVSTYAKLLKEWKGFEAPDDGLRDHQIRYLPRDFRLFEAMREGSEYPELHRLANQIFEQEAKRRSIRPDTAAWKSLKAAMVPPYDPNKFPNKWWKLVRNGPVRTLMAHLGKDGYSHIHYDSAQARTISVREAARLQSFPDGFRFCGTMNPAFRQIGNSVPPLMAKALAEEMLQALRAEGSVDAASGSEIATAAE